jgi:hypothetical protein|tara:strand:- start:158 stop:349 length:192 start_codon:yes stop_codon:yes gene_type:complete
LINEAIRINIVERKKALGKRNIPILKKLIPLILLSDSLKIFLKSLAEFKIKEKNVIIFILTIF